MNSLMIVDDEAIITMQLAMRLRSMGYDVVGTASSAEESVRMAKDLNPNLILMDIVMPGDIDGINAAKIIKDEMDIPIIFLTAYTDDEYIKRAKNVSPFGYIVKPYSDNEVKANIEIAIHKKELERKQIESFDSVIKHEKRKQMLLLQSERLDAMRTMTAGIAHEFNNVFAVISGNAQLLKDGYKDDKELKNGLNSIKKAIDRGAKIIREMKGFNDVKIDTAGYFHFNIGKVIKHALDFTMPRWRDEAKSRGISYNIDKEGIKGLPVVFGNPSEIKEVLVNIINNALDAMPDCGTITVATRCVRSEELGVESKKEIASELRAQNSELKGEFVEITFADTGKGMTDDVKNRMFDPFFTTRSPEGTGLSMSTAYSMTIRNGGRISVESEPGKGTTVTIRFGMTKEIDNPVVLSRHTQEREIRGGNIMVLDDDETICRFLDKVLSEEGYTVKTANNGVDAIKLLEEETFDLMLSDNAMTNVKGFDLIKSLDALENRPETGIITGREDESVIKKKNDLKAHFIAEKPLNIPELLRGINDALNAG